MAVQARIGMKSFNAMARSLQRMVRRQSFQRRLRGPNVTAAPAAAPIATPMATPCATSLTATPTAAPTATPMLIVIHIAVPLRQIFVVCCVCILFVRVFCGLTNSSSAAAGARVKPEEQSKPRRPGGRLQRRVRPANLPGRPRPRNAREPTRSRAPPPEQPSSATGYGEDRRGIRRNADRHGPFAGARG